MKLKTFLALGAAAAWAISMPAAASVTLDLDSVATGAFTSLDLGDYVINWVGFGDLQTVTDVNGTHVLQDSDQSNPYGAEIVISRKDGGLFSLLSADIAALSGLYQGYDIQIGASYYFPGSSGFTTVNPAGATNVSDIHINLVDGGSSFAVKNLVVEAAAPAAVPEPASWALMLGGFGLVGGALRTRKRSVSFA